MENGFLDKVEDNAAVQTWSETTQWEKGDSLAEGMYQSCRTSLVDKHLFRALAQFWNPVYSCFTFGGVDLVPTVEEYMVLLRCSKIQADKANSRAVNVPTFLKKLMNITEMNTKKKVDVFALSVYGLVVFPKALGHVDETVTDLFDRLDKRVTPVPLLLAWFHSHFWKVDKVSYWVFSENYSPLKEIVAILRRDDISEEKWIAILQNLQEEDIEWRAPWIPPDKILYRCGIFDWVPLLGIWGAVGYVPLLVLRQYRSRQFVPATQGLA
ncbi:hypothetical protein Godav_022223 [Gossypium davidsonii]|uniref:DUF7745 domain-containing protein n=1 Tax=Gossypium davidsonii TaxID=34287 RepID=A0A7J8TKG6_GOSDV|nr:hypothetical protein [Gossypium davidsonii]